MKITSKLLVFFLSKFLRKAMFGILNPILGKLGVTHNLGCWLAGKPVVDFLFTLIFFAICYGSRATRKNVYSSAVFTGGRPLCILSLPGQGHPHQPTRNTGLPF